MESDLLFPQINSFRPIIETFPSQSVSSWVILVRSKYIVSFRKLLVRAIVKGHLFELVVVKFTMQSVGLGWAAQRQHHMSDIMDCELGEGSLSYFRAQTNGIRDRRVLVDFEQGRARQFIREKP
jgi:hypothetical protein